MTDCIACDLTSGRANLPGGVIIQTDSWALEHCVGPLGIGTLILKPVRHSLGLWDLTDVEAAELGPLTRLAVSAIKSLTDADQVFSSLWSFSGGEPGHIHYVLQPVTKALRDGVGKSGPFIQTAMFEANELPEPGDVEGFCDRARAWFRERQNSLADVAIRIPG